MTHGRYPLKEKCRWRTAGQLSKVPSNCLAIIGLRLISRSPITRVKVISEPCAMLPRNSELNSSIWYVLWNLITKTCNMDDEKSMENAWELQCSISSSRTFSEMSAGMLNTVWIRPSLASRATRLSVS